MTELATLLDRVWFTQWVLALPALLAVALCIVVRARPATRASVATALAAATMLPWILPVLVEPGGVLRDVRIEFAATEMVRAANQAGASVFRISDVLWLAGSAIACCWVALGVFGARRELRRMRPADADTVDRVRQLARELGVRPPRVLECDAPISPAVFCVPRARLILPVALWRELPPRTRDSLLLHELAHLRRRDHWLRATVGLAAIVGWWNPVVWMLRSMLRRNSEEAADAWVAELRPGAREQYASGLLATERHLASARSHGLRPALSAMSPSARILARRLRRLFAGVRPRSSRAGAVLLAAVGGTAIGSSWLAVQATAPSGETTPAARRALGIREFFGRALIRIEGDTRAELLPEYVDRLRTSRSARERRRAADDLGNLFERGTTAVPALLHAMAHDDSASVRREAVDAIGRIGPHVADEAMPQLMKTLANDPAPRVRREVEDVLERFGG